MKNRCLFAVIVLTLIPLLVPALGQTSLTITVSTDKQNYDLGQLIVITGSVHQSGAPVPNAVVVFELRDPQNQVKASGFMNTDSSGAYSRQLTIGNDFPLGAYTVYVSVTVGSQSASATTKFQAIPEFLSSLVPVIALVITIGILRGNGKQETWRKR